MLGGVSALVRPLAPLPVPPPPRAPAAKARVATGRIGGIDAARALAIVGMVMVHVGPFDVAPGAAGWLYRLTYGRASILFVTLAGVGVSLLAGDRSQQRLSRALWQIAWRVAIFLPLGLYLQELDTPVAVILQYYAAYYVVAAAALRLSDRVLLTIIAVWTVVGPVLWLLGDHDRGVAEPGDVLAVASGLWVDGIYPVLTWGPAILFGVWLGRRDLRATRTRWLLLAGGMGAAAVAYGGSELLRALFGQPVGDAGFDRLLLAEGHSGMPLNIIGAVGVATALLGACLLLASALPRLTWPLVAMGQLALTIYVGHLIVLANQPEWLVARDDVVDSWLRIGRFALVCLVLATLWRLVFTRGPLEELLHLPFRRRGDRTLQGTPWKPLSSVAEGRSTAP